MKSWNPDADEATILSKVDAEFEKNRVKAFQKVLQTSQPTHSTEVSIIMTKAYLTYAAIEDGGASWMENYFKLLEEYLAETKHHLTN